MIFDFLGNLVQTFLDYTDEGAIFVFGDNYMDHFFAFKVRSIEDGEEGVTLKVIQSKSQKKSPQFCG